MRNYGSAADATAEEVLPALGVRIHRPAGVKDGYELVYEIDLAEGGRALIVNDVLARFPDKVAEYRKGKKGLLGMFMGEVMKNSKGKAEPQATTKLLQEKLSL